MRPGACLLSETKQRNKITNEDDKKIRSYTYNERDGACRSGGAAVFGAINR